MADVKISALTAASTPLVGTETLPVVQSAVTKNTTIKEIAKFGYQDILTESTAAKTLALTDIGQWIRFTSSATVALTVPTNAVVAFVIGTTINGIQASSGQISVSSSATINKPSGYNAKTRAQGSAFCLVKVATDAWDLIGDLEATA